MYYEQFLYTRVGMRGPAAFVLPESTTDADVETLVGVVGAESDVTWLTAAHPALYCFPLGAYTYLLRYYDSGRRDERGAVGVLEGIAVPRTVTRTFAGHMHTFIRLQHDYLNVMSTLPGIEASDPGPSERHSLRITHIRPPQPSRQEDATVRAFAEHQADARLVVPFAGVGLRLLVAAVTDPGIPPLVRFAFGATSEAAGQIASLGVDLDIVGYFGVSQPALWDRRSGAVRMTFADYPREMFIPPEEPVGASAASLNNKPPPIRYRETPSGERVPIDPPPRRSVPAPRRPLETYLSTSSEDTTKPLEPPRDTAPMTAKGSATAEQTPNANPLWSLIKRLFGIH